ncbi:conserved hypothetical protein [Theileria orientalis strain Shintoku]|uniref:AP2/ERF domain-containing protein n=1 Tax=Theileria orientalis strain Shintoku TaxID=869250 RepID=J7M4I5_THEOR|nr:conserved hypothetical protein [Theileria orientalis strain Shintoku]BAM38595.1 conserved hypothetical protein [Theileria orientalis strain Shintoku]|eukprot:XP_009688896.1 conserved hypothetical protein [Theileria orientalis strain Shintoku]
MAKDTPKDQVNVTGRDVKDTGNRTHIASENTNVNDVDALLSCIDIWKKNSKKCKRTKKANVFKKNRVSIKQNNDLERVNNVVKDLLSMTKLRAEIPKNVLVAKRKKKKPAMDKRTLISTENFPMEFSDEEDLPEYLRTKVPKQGSIDTRFATESSNENNGEFNFLSHLNKDPDSSTLQMMDKEGNSIESRPLKSKDVREMCETLGITSLNMMQFESLENETSDSEELLNGDEFMVDENYEESEESEEELEVTIEESGSNVETEIAVAEFKTKTPKTEEPPSEDAPGRKRNYRRKSDTKAKSLVAVSSAERAAINEDEISLGTKANGRTSRTRRNTNRNPLAEEVVDIKNMEIEKIRGVCYCKSDNSWTAWWTEKGKSRKKAFKLSLYGFEGARRLAIEHRMRMEELLPELKEKKTKVNKRKTSEALGPKTNKKSPGTTSRNITRACSNTPAAIVPSMEDGIYKGTRYRSKQNKDKEGVFVNGNTCNTNLNTSLDSNPLNLQVNNEDPFSDARQNGTYAHSHNQDTIVNINDNADLCQTNDNRSNGSRDDVDEANYLPYKRKRPNSYHPDICRINEIEHFHELEDIMEYLEMKGKEENGGVYSAETLRQIRPITPRLNISSHIYHQHENGLCTVHYRIKLEKSTLEQVQNAIKEALDDLPNKEETNENNDSDNAVAQEETRDPQSPSAEDDYVNVEAVSITSADGTNRPLYNIIPTYIKNSDGDEVLAFVVLKP